MSTLRLSGASLEGAATRLGIPTPEEPKQPPITPEEARRRRRDAVNALWDRLAEAYPAAIAPRNHAPRHPLKIGIDQDIRDQFPDVPVRTRREFIRRYVRQIGYLRLLRKPGAVRVNLEGNPSGDVTEDEAKNAIERLTQRAAGNTPHDGGKQ